MTDECEPALGGHVHELGADEIEPDRRLPGERVADEDPVGPLWEPAAREHGEHGCELQPERLDAVGAQRTIDSSR
jgi:hypothetical protein